MTMGFVHFGHGYWNDALLLNSIYINLFIYLFMYTDVINHCVFMLCYVVKINWKTIVGRCGFFLLFALVPLLCVVDVRRYTPPCSTGVHRTSFPKVPFL